MSGTEKSLLEIGGSAILDRQLAVLRPRFSEILVVVAPPGIEGARAASVQTFASRGLRIVEDRFPGSGPMAGLHAALLASRNEWIFAVGCDMPFLDGDLIDRMLDHPAVSAGAAALVPLRENRPEPLHALYRASVARDAESCLREGLKAMTDLLDRARATYLGEEDLPGVASGRSFVNVNSAEDLAALRAPGAAAAATDSGR